MPEINYILEQGSVAAARQLIGWRFYVIETDGSKTGGTIVETEAYSQIDAASHSYRGATPRTEIMFGPAGHLYVYFTYGMHWCANIVTGKQGEGEAVLLRAILPEQNIEIIRERRPNQPDHLLTNGPAKLCQALLISGADKGAPISGGRFLLEPPTKTYEVQATPRIGISQDTYRLWRFIAV
jgi:DNA-3-methyladenine glycosylase